MSAGGGEPLQWKVAVNAPLRKAFTYQGDESLKLSPGMTVKVPFGLHNREVRGWVLEPNFDPPSQAFETKKIISLDKERPPLSDLHMKWLKWLSDYYVHPLGQIQSLVFPPLQKKTKGKSRKEPIVPEVESTPLPPLTEEQKKAVQTVEVGKPGTYLLHGVTGSGKTEVYIKLIQEVMDREQGVLVLVPEISLTPQLIRRFAEKFPGQIAVIHSYLTDREKTDQWWSVVEGQKKLLIGARSALFCPMPNMGLIIIDEEHETSFKQEESLKYNARDGAIVKAQIFECPIILGSATPSLESWKNALEGKYQLISMENRVHQRPLPQIQIINPGKDRDPQQELPYWLSQTLFKKLKTSYEKGHQAALFLNRRGVAPHVQCYDCGFSYECPNCDISLTLHGKNHLVCHYCGYHDSMAEECPDCSEGEPKASGLGTEALERDLQKLFPESTILRADRDEISNREGMEAMVERMESQEVHFLVGTQIIAKGLDFKNLNLVGIVHADVAFNIPDFRASERSFQLCTQVSGRAGRHLTPGEVVIQTYKEDHLSLVKAKGHDYPGFAAQELEQRLAFNYPPFGKITSIRMSGIKAQALVQEGEKIVFFLKALVKEFYQLAGTQVLGPTPAPLSRLKNRYRYHILIKGKDHRVMNFMATRVEAFIKDHCKQSKCLIDVDPYTLI